MKISKEVKIGILVTAALALLIYGFNFLKGRDLFSNNQKFYAIYSDIDGLIEANPVQVNGFQVGRVDKIALAPGSSGRMIVTLIVSDRNIKIPKNTIAKIISPDLLGSKAVKLILGTGTDYAQSGDTLASDIQSSLSDEVNRQVAPLKAKAENLLLSLDSVMAVVQAIFNKDARENLSKSFESIKTAIQTFEKTSLRIDTLVIAEKGRLSNIFSKIESISSNFAGNNEKLSDIINNFSAISDSLAKANIKSTIDNANIALNNASIIINKINKGEGSMGLLINNDTLYKKLEASSADIDRLLIDIKENPHRYLHFSVFGKKVKKNP